MRLLSLELSGFRGFAARQTIDLDANAVVVVGANGNGKTSLFDAILWAISGRIPRLGNDDSLLVNRFSGTGQARVAVRLGREDGAFLCTVTRVFDGESTKVSLETAESVLRGPEAEGRLIQLVWSEAAIAASPAESMATALTRCVYLQQDLVRDFIESVTPQDRFGAVSELVGAGRVTDFQAELEIAKKAWSSSTNSQKAEQMPLRSRLATMQSRLNELEVRQRREEEVLGGAEWAGWWGKLHSIGLKINQVDFTSREAASAIDSAIRQLDASRSAAERRKLQLNTLAQELRSTNFKGGPDLGPMRERVAAAREATQATQAAIVREQARMAEARRLQSELKESREQLRALAALALQHLGDRCPVCRQEYDVEATRRRLEETASGGEPVATESVPPDSLSVLLASLTDQEGQLSGAQADLRSAERAIQEREGAERGMRKQLAEFGIERPTTQEQLAAVEAAIDATSSQLEEFAVAKNAGEQLSLKLSRNRDEAAIQELRREVSATQRKLQEDDLALASRVATGDLAQSVIVALREAASRVVAERVREIEPLLSDIYGRIDVHPAFRVVRFLTSVVRGRGHLSAVVSDPLSEVECDSPSTVLSSSQMNALAVCTFLALNLGLASPPLAAAILDDPLQSLDDINLLGLVDLLRRTKDQRQLIVSTHDPRFGSLLARKLRPGSPQQRTIVIELDGWSRNGPAIAVRDVHCDPAPLRLLSLGA